MTNGRLWSPESEAKGQTGTGMTHTVATFLDSGGTEEGIKIRTSGRRRAWDVQRGRVRRRGGAHNSTVRDEQPEKGVDPAESHLRLSTLSFRSGDGEQKRLQRREEEIGGYQQGQ